MITIQSLEKYFNIINHILIILSAVFFVCLSWGEHFQGTSLHALLVVIGFQCLASEALMSHYPENCYTNAGRSHLWKSRYHAVLQAIAGTLVICGSTVKYLSTAEHYQTVHGLIGLSASLMCIASLIGGICNYFQFKFLQYIYTKAMIRFRHNLFGILTYTLGNLAILFGYFTKFGEKHFSNGTLIALVISNITIYLLTIISPCRSLYRKWRHLKWMKANTSAGES